jgi:hypothetical protein
MPYLGCTVHRHLFSNDLSIFDCAKILTIVLGIIRCNIESSAHEHVQIAVGRDPWRHFADCKLRRMRALFSVGTGVDRPRTFGCIPRQNHDVTYLGRENYLIYHLR